MVRSEAGEACQGSSRSLQLLANGGGGGRETGAQWTTLRETVGGGVRWGRGMCGQGGWGHIATMIQNREPGGNGRTKEANGQRF